MSDLQCPATLLLVGVGEAGQDGPALAELLRPRRVALVYTDDLPASARAGAALGDALGVPVRADGDLPSATAVEALADLHRGETVLVVAARTGVLAGALRTLGAGGAPAPSGEAWPFGPDVAVEVRADADGWVYGGAEAAC